MPVKSSSQDCLQISLVSPNEVSIYSGKLSPKCLCECIALIKKSFPSLPIGFYDVLTERLKNLNFSDQRLKDAVNHVIDTCVYPTPTIASFISFDKTFKIYNYSEYLEMVNEGVGGDSYKPIKLFGNKMPVWIHINDIEKYNLKSE